jgi:hypothetical protein
MLLEAGKHYHIYNCGNNQEVLFKEPRNYPYFLSLWKRHIFPIADTYAYNLLPTHFHFAIVVRQGTGRTPTDFSRSFANMFAAYAKAVNKGYERTGSLFQKNFRRKEITSPLSWTRLILYIHTNAQRHGLVQHFAAHAHSSFAAMLTEAPTLLRRSDVLELFGTADDFLQAHEKFEVQEADLIRLFEDARDDG